MVTTSSTLAAGTASGGRHSGGKGRVMGAVVAAALGLGLLAGGLLGHGRQAAPAAPPDQRANPYWTYREDVTLNGNPALAVLGTVADAGTDDLATTTCSGTPGPFACAAARPRGTGGPDDPAMPRCSQTPGPFACAAIPPPGPLVPPGPANFPGEDR